MIPIFNAAKISVGCAASILISMLIGLDYSITAGLITVLSIQSTKKETAEIAIKRLLSYFSAILIAFCSFTALGYTPFGFTVYIFAFILVCGMFKAQSAIVPISVLISHILAEKSFALGILVNEFLLLFIGAGVAFLLNLYLRRDMEKMRKYRTDVDEEIKGILSRMAERVLISDKSDYNGDCFKRLKGYIQNAKNTALANKQNTLHNTDNYDMLYLEMREKQCIILQEMYKAVKELNATPTQVYVISGLLKKISEEYHEINTVEDLLCETDRIIQEMKGEKMPQTREEFENRAVLYSLLIRIKEFLSIKNLFVQTI